MKRNFLRNEQLSDLLDRLRDFGELHAPVRSGQGVMTFSPLHDLADLHLEYSRTQIPPKKYLLPFREEILYAEDGIYGEGRKSLEDTVLFGVHPCDLDGIAYLDLVFLGESPDSSYAARRERLTLVGISCSADDFCFCPGYDTPPSCDLFLFQTPGGFTVRAFSEKGKAIAAATGDLLSEGAAAEETICTGSRGIGPQDPELRFSDNPLWEKFAQTCVSCGACSVCCPTCYCFDVREYPTLSGGAARIREWDNCLFVTHGEVAGANFRESRLDRLRYRFLHKYCGFTPLVGMTSCVGCGRCKAVCPVGIDLREVTDRRRVEERGAP